MTNDIQNYSHVFGVDNVKKIHVDPIQNETLITKIALANKDNKTLLAWDLAIINSHLVPYIIHKHFIHLNDKDYMMSDGIQGLFEACKRVREDAKNKSFISYAITYIYRFIINGIRERSGQVYYPDNVRKTIRSNEFSINNMDLKTIQWVNTITSDNDNTEKIIKNSDGEFCKNFLKLSVKHHRKSRKKYGRPGIVFYSEKSRKILKALGKLDMVEVHVALGIHKQVVSQTEQSAFVYMLQYLRDAPDSYSDEFFNVVFNGKYNFKNPPPFEGWRKRIWEEIMSLEKNTFTTASYHLTPWYRNKKNEKK